MDEFEKCKQVGRIGPPKTQMDQNSVFGRVKDENLLLSGDAREFNSIRADTGFFKGVWYYEATLKTDGLQQIGWCTLVTPFNDEDGVGDDPSSFAFDGYRVKTWNGDSQATYGKRWKEGDNVGCLLDLEERKIHFYLNGRDLGIAF